MSNLYTITVQHNVRLHMRDGVELSGQFVDAQPPLTPGKIYEKHWLESTPRL